MWQISFLSIQETLHRFPLTQCGFLASAVPPLRQELINCFRALPVMPVACALQSFMRCCCGVSWALADDASAAMSTMVIKYFFIESPCPAKAVLRSCSSYASFLLLQLPDPRL
jgi:hypothetical protein